MPLFFEQNTEHQGVLGIWRIREDEAYFRKRLKLTHDEKEVLSKIKGSGRRVEWLAVRYLLHHLSGRLDRAAVIKDEYGKPFIPDSDYHISISHSHEMAAVLASPISCGVDIQYPVEKIRRLVPKFCSPEEVKETKKKNALQTMHVIWGAKECIYKAYGRREVDYKSHIAIPQASQLMIRPGTGTLIKNKVNREYEIRTKLVLDYVLTYCFQI